MASKKVQIQIDTKADTSGAKQAESSLNKLDSAAKNTNNTVNTTTASTSKLGGVMGNAGYQIQDFAVQVGAGTSALTAFAQQAPQLLGSFGPQGAIAGAIVAVGAIAAKVFINMAENAAMSGEAMEDMGDKLKEAFSAATTRSVDEFNAKITETTTLARTLRDAELMLKEARDQQNASNARLIDSQLKLDEAAIKYLDSTGQIVDAEKALLEVRTKAAEATKQAQIADVTAQVESARAQYNNIVKQRQDVESEVDEARKRMAALEAQQQQVGSDRAFFAKQDKQQIKYGIQKEGFVSANSQEANARYEGLQKEIENLYKIIQNAPQKLSEITNQAYEQAATVDAAVTTAEIQINEINTKFNLTQKAQELNTAADTVKTGAKEIASTIEQFTPLTEQQAAAKASIQKALEDGKITAQEQQQIGASLQMLMSSLQTGQAANLSALQDLVKINNDLALKVQAINKDTINLRKQVNALQGIR